MYAVTKEFLSQMKAPVRRVDARVAIDYTDPTQDQTIEVTASEQANASYPAQTADFATEPAYKWAALDGTWVLDGTWHLAPVPEDAYLHQMGWWSAQVAGEDGRFSEPYPTLILTHPARPVIAFQVVGDSARGEWPTEFAIRLYGPDGTLLRERVVTGNAEIQFYELLVPPALDVTRQELEIRAWSHPGRHAKILEFFTSLQETYEGNDLLEVHLLEESESGAGVGTGGVSTNEITVRLVNRDGRFDVINQQSPLRELLRPNRRVRAWLGIRGAGNLWGNGWYAPFDRDLVLARRDGVVLEPLPGHVATLRPNEGRVGGAVAVEEGTTNLVYDSGTIFLGTHISPDELPAPPPVTPVFCYTWTNLNWRGDIELAKTFQAGDVVTISGWIYESGPWARLSIYGTENGTAKNFGDAFKPTGQIGWHYFEKTVVFQGETTRFRIEDGGWDYYNPDRADESQIWLVNVQMEEKPFATSFVAGTRAAGQLTYDVLPNGDFTVSTWFRAIPPLSWFDPTRYMALLQLAEYATSGARYWFEVNDNRFRTSRIGSLAPYDNEWHHLVAVAADGNLRVYFDGEYKGVAPLEFTPRFLRVGHRMNGDSHANALFDELLILPYAASDEFIAELYRETRPLYDEWVPLGVFWSTEWDSEDLEAMVRARDRMELLRRTTFEPGPLKQNVSLYELAQDVLAHAQMPPETYRLDPGLQDIVVPWGWVPPGTHRDALRVIAEAGTARVYCDRDGILRVERVTAPTGHPVLEITQDDYFPPARNPVTSALVANRVVVTTQPLAPASSPEEVYRATVEVPAEQTIAVRAEYNKRPVIDAAASLESPPAGVSIVEGTYGAAGAEITIRNTGASAASVALVITGRPLSVEGGEQVAEEDDLSIRELGLIVHEAPSNPLIQTREHARTIAQAILARSAQQRRDVELEWRGNPALEANDVVSVDGMQAQVVRQELSWVGALSARLLARRLTS